MVTKQVLRSNWSDIQDRLHDKWNDLDEDELRQFDGTVQQLVALVQGKTGETRDAIESFLDDVVNGSPSAVKDAAHSVKEFVGRAVKNAGGYAGSAASIAQEAAQEAARQVRASYDETERLVRRRPIESIAACFGVGLITGVVLAVILRSR